MYKIIANVPYGTDPLQVVDYLIPDKEKLSKDVPMGVHIHYHGGAWSAGDKNDMNEVTLAKHAAYVSSSQDRNNTIIVLVNYRLRPQVSMSFIYADALAAFKSVMEETLNQGMNPNDTKITLSGTSAGAHLVATLVSRESDLKILGKKTYLHFIQDVVLYALPGDLREYAMLKPHPLNEALDPNGTFWDWTELDPGSPEIPEVPAIPLKLRLQNFFLSAGGPTPYTPYGGDILSGGTSGATATVVAGGYNSTTGITEVINVSGSFEVGENVFFTYGSTVTGCDLVEIIPEIPAVDAVPEVLPFLKFSPLGLEIKTWLQGHAGDSGDLNAQPPVEPIPTSGDYVEYNPCRLLEASHNNTFRTSASHMKHARFNLHMFHGDIDMIAPLNRADHFLMSYEILSGFKESSRGLWTVAPGMEQYNPLPWYVHDAEPTTSLKVYENDSHSMLLFKLDPDQRISTVIPHPWTIPPDESSTHGKSQFEPQLKSLMDAFRSLHSPLFPVITEFDHENMDLMETNANGNPVLAGGTITLAPGAFTACGDNPTIALLDANLFKIIDKARSIDKNMSALAWTTELQTLGNDIVNTMRDELDIQSLSDILDKLPKPVGSIAEDLIKIGLLMESVKGGGVDMATLNKVMAAFDTDYKDVLNGLGLDANKIVKTLGDIQKNPVSTILSETGLCDKIPNISKLASGEIKEILDPIKLAISPIENEMATAEDIIIVSANKIKEDLEAELKNTKELSSKNEDITKQMIPDYNQFVGNSLAISNILKLRTPIMDNPKYAIDNPIGGGVPGIPSYYSSVKDITDISKKLDSGIPKSLPGLTNTDQSIHQMTSFVNNKSSEEDPRGTSQEIIDSMIESLREGINFTDKELEEIDFKDPSSVINAIKSNLPEKDSVLFPKDPLNFNDPNDAELAKDINAFNKKIRLNDYIDSALKSDNTIRLNSYLAQRNLNGFPEIEDFIKDSMWKNDPYFGMDFLKEKAKYTDLEYRTSFTSEELEAVTREFNLIDNDDGILPIPSPDMPQ